MKKLKTIPAHPLLPDGVAEPPQMLINQISRLFAAMMRESDIEMSQESVRYIIINLARQDGVTQLDLVNKTHMKPPTVSLTLKRLESDGYVRRQQDLEDNRAVRVFLTEKGRNLLNNSFERLQAAEQVLMRGISPAEKEILITILTKMRDNMLDEMRKGENPENL